MTDNAKLARYFQLATKISVSALIMTMAVQMLIFRAGDNSTNFILWLLASLPLTIFLRGVWLGRINTFIWLSFVSLLYFAQSVTALFAPAWRGLDVLHLLLSIALFISAMLSARFLARAQRAVAHANAETAAE